jgi:hypothetical protein
MKKKKCPFCPASFLPNPRVGERQKTCGGQACQKALKAANNLRWRKTNPEYYRRDFDRLKDWLADHPGYLKAHRQSHPDYVAKNRIAQRLRDRRKKSRLDIQAQLKAQLPDLVDQLWRKPDLDIQTPIETQPLKMALLLGSLACLDIQTPIDRPACLRHNRPFPSGGGPYAIPQPPGPAAGP